MKPSPSLSLGIYISRPKIIPCTRQSIWSLTTLYCKAPSVCLFRQSQHDEKSKEISEQQWRLKKCNASETMQCTLDKKYGRVPMMTLESQLFLSIPQASISDKLCMISSFIRFIISLPFLHATPFFFSRLTFPREIYTSVISLLGESPTFTVIVVGIQYKIMIGVSWRIQQISTDTVARTMIFL